MAYTPKTWECGETITAEKLNHIEQGIAENSGGGTALIIREERTEDCPEGFDGAGVAYCNATYQQVKDAYDAGLPVYLQTGANRANVRFLLAFLRFNPTNGYEVGFISLAPSGTNYASVVLTASTETEELQLHMCSAK